MADDIEFEKLLQLLRSRHGCDFQGYRRAGLRRRISRRMEMVGIRQFGRYARYLEKHPGELAVLLGEVLVKVTSFFRDPPAWAHLRRRVIPDILRRKGPDAPIRAWSAGCASGEEAYSLAILFLDALGVDAFRERVRIYATDVDEEALARTRLASYSAKDLDAVAPGARQRYFEPRGSRFVFREDLRGAVICGRHDLTRDPPLQRLDLLACRNTLMYFTADAQGRALERFHFALGGGPAPGCLFLGRAEMPLAHASLFRPLSLRHRLFESLPAAGTRQGEPGLPAAEGTLSRELLRSYSEELEVLKQELLSATVEMAAMNRELQSAHADLRALRDALRRGARPPAGRGGPPRCASG